MGIRADMFAMRRYVQAQIRCGSGDFEGGEECAVVGAGDVCGFEVAYGHAFVMHDMVDFGDRHHGRVRHVQAFARLLAGIQEAAAEQVVLVGKFSETFAYVNLQR